MQRRISQGSGEGCRRSPGLHLLPQNGPCGLETALTVTHRVSFLKARCTTHTYRENPVSAGLSEERTEERKRGNPGERRSVVEN